LISALYIHKIVAIRYAKVGTNTLGGPVNSSASVSAPYIPCRIEGYSANEQYRDSNNRPINTNVVYIPPQYDIHVDDQIYDVTTGYNYIGKVSGVNAALLGMTTNLDHWELSIENP